jgi:hypothetical protein
VITFIVTKGVTQNMNTFKRKALFTAVAAGLGVAGSAEAVYLNPNGTGQSLVYPYYTVQTTSGAAYNTLLSIVNTTSRGKAIKVRILEGKTSSEVLDFNLFLSANDVWTAGIIPSTNGVGGAIVSADNSCISPASLATAQDFRNYQYASGLGGSSLPGVGLDRTREGYVEMLEMGTIPTGSALATAITHNSAGVPPNCAGVQAITFTPAATDLTTPTGGMFGTGTLLNLTNGQAAGYKADALESWSNVVQYTSPGITTPNLGSAVPATSLVINAGSLDATGASMRATAYLSAFATGAGPGAGVKAVASVYMHQTVMNEYVLDSGSRTQTDWVITQPLKNAFVTNTTALPPYSNVLTASGACETINFTYFNREERQAATSPGDFSPPPPGATPSSLCWEVNVLSLRNNPVVTGQPTGATSGLLGSVNTTAVSLGTNALFPNGWAALDFIGVNATSVGLGATAATQRVLLDQTLVPAATITTAAVTFFGLPVTGFMVRNFANASIACTGVTGAAATCQGLFGSLFNHSYRNNIIP